MSARLTAILAGIGMAVAASPAPAQFGVGGFSFDSGPITLDPGPVLVDPGRDGPGILVGPEETVDPTEIITDPRFDVPFAVDPNAGLILQPTDLDALDTFLSSPDALARQLNVSPEILRRENLLNGIRANPGLLDLPVVDPSRFPGLDPIDYVLFPAGPDDAGGAVLGNFGNRVIANPNLATPPAIERLGTPEHLAYAAACGAAVDAFLPERQTIYGGCVAASPETRAQCVALLDAYVDNCLVDPNVAPDALPPTVAAANQATPDQISGIKAATGVLYQAGENGEPGQIYCTAVQISARLVATARHCLFRDGTSEERASGANRREISSIGFFTFASPATPVTFKGVIESLATGGNTLELPYVLSGDYVFLEVAWPMAVPVEVHFSEPKVNDELVLFSYQIAARLASQLDQPVTDDELIADGTWRQFMRYDSAATCQVAELPEPSCVVHACQTEVASSGAPLFRLGTTGSLELLGIQVRHIVVTDDGTCANKTRSSTPNIGVWPAPEDRQVADAN